MIAAPFLSNHGYGPLHGAVLPQLFSEPKEITVVSGCCHDLVNLSSGMVKRNSKYVQVANAPLASREEVLIQLRSLRGAQSPPPELCPRDQTGGVRRHES